MSDYYNQTSLQSDIPRLKMLLDYLSRHEKYFEESLVNFEKDSSEKILNTWFKYTPDSNTLQGCGCEEFQIKSNMTVDEVIQIALKVDQCLINFYQQMTENCVIPEIKEIFDNLLEMEKREDKKMIKDVMLLKEM